MPTTTAVQLHGRVLPLRLRGECDVSLPSPALSTGAEAASNRKSASGFFDGSNLQQASETELVELERSIGRLRTQRAYISRLGEEMVAKDERIAELEALVDQFRDRIRLVERNNEDVDALVLRAKKAEESARISAGESAKKGMEVARMFEYVLGHIFVEAICRKPLKTRPCSSSLVSRAILTPYFQNAPGF